MSFNFAYWFSVPPTAARSRAQALALAQQIAEQAQQNPAQFPELARQYSEDLPTRQEGGSLGGLEASQLTSWPQVLDALAELHPGQASRVVETRYGFHIFLRSPPPAEEVMAGSHIVIGHEKARWLVGFARDPLPKRSRDEALDLANEIYRQADAQPERFSGLVMRYSEHRDALVDGDFGAWSTREPSPYPPRLKRLGELANGQVGAPIETHVGFEIIRRTPLRPRKQFRARWVAFATSPLDSEAPATHPAERASALAKARAFAKVLARAPEQFGASAHVEQWEEGRGVSGLSPLLKRLRPGQVASTPIESEYGFLVAQRLVPELVQPSELKTELPAPEQPDLEVFFRSLAAADVRGFLHMFAEQIRHELALAGSVGEQLRQLHDLDGRLRDEASPDTQWAVVDGILDGVRALLDADQYSRYVSFLHLSVKTTLLEPQANSPPELGL